MALALLANSSGKTLTATSRCSRESWARYTSPIPPVPRGPRMTYGPRCVPAARGIDFPLGDVETSLSTIPPRRGLDKRVEVRVLEGKGCGKNLAEREKFAWARGA